jgi:hypothetical protein
MLFRVPEPQEEQMAKLQAILESPLGKQSQHSLTTQMHDILSMVELLRQQLDELTVNNEGVPRLKQRLKELTLTLDDFRLFSGRYYGFIVQNSKSKLAMAQQALTKIQHELLTLRPLIEQRHSPSLLEQLRIADEIANDLLKRCYGDSDAAWTRVGRKKPGACLTFFEDVHFIRLATYSYNRLPSISLPTSAWQRPWLWMGLAHELGHFVYRNLVEGEADGAQLAEQLRQEILKTLLDFSSTALSQPPLLETVESFQLWCSWIEEIFADVFGALVLGPSYVESLIVWLAARVEGVNDLLENDKDHPANLLRPLIQLEALQQLYPMNKFGAQAQLELTELQKKWERFCTALLPGQAVTFAAWNTKRIGESQATVALLKSQIGPVVQRLIGLLTDVKSSLRVDSPATSANTHAGFYTPEAHHQIKALADQLVLGNAQAPLGDLAPVFALPVAWYAWQAQPTAACEQTIHAWLTTIFPHDKPVQPDASSISEDEDRDSFSIVFDDLANELKKEEGTKLLLTSEMIDLDGKILQEVVRVIHQAAGEQQVGEKEIAAGANWIIEQLLEIELSSREGITCHQACCARCAGT